jgi:hypothetical protein
MDSIDKKLSDTFPSSMREGLQIKIERVCGFELFGAYETWDSGYFVTIPGREASDEWYLEKDKLGRREIKTKNQSLEKAVDEALFNLKNVKPCSICGYLYYSRYNDKCCSVCYLKGSK